ncbi:MAG: hypothetical protein WDN25_16670 [Acetobacteraceae bacterium]
MISITARLLMVETSPASGVRRQLHHGRAGTGDRQLDPLLGADRHVLHPRRLAVAADRQVGGGHGMRHAQILDGDPQGDGLADQAVAWRLDHAQAAVGLLTLRRHQDIERRAARWRLRHVVHLAVGDRDRAGQPRARDIRQRPVDRAEQPGARVAALGHGDRAKLQIRQLPGLLCDLGACRLGQPRTLAHAHRRALVDHEQADIGQVVAALLHHAGAGQPQQQHREGGEAPHGAARTPERGQRDGEEGQHAEGGRSATAAAAARSGGRR